MQVVDFKTIHHPNRDPIHMVLVAPQGPHFASVQTWHRVKDLQPRQHVDERTAQSPHYRALLSRWEIVEPRFRAYLDGQDIPEDGTPLEAWGGVTKEQLATLKRMSIKTVEDVRDMSEAAIGACRWPNARKLPELAKAFLESQDTAARDAENAELRERLAAMEEMLIEATNPDAPKKRGRPKNVEEAA